MAAAALNGCAGRFFSRESRRYAMAMKFLAVRYTLACDDYGGHKALFGKRAAITPCRNAADLISVLR
jgi:hypothetical protein